MLFNEIGKLNKGLSFSTSYIRKQKKRVKIFNKIRQKNATFDLWLQVQFDDWLTCNYWQWLLGLICSESAIIMTILHLWQHLWIKEIKIAKKDVDKEAKANIYIYIYNLIKMTWRCWFLGKERKFEIYEEWETKF